MDNEKFPDELRTYKGKDFVQKSFYPIYALLGLSFLLIVIGFSVALSKAATVSAELKKMHSNITKDPFNHDLKLFPCGPDTRQWEYFGGKCYFFSLRAVSWHEARYHCERQRSQLVVIDNLAEQWSKGGKQLHTRYGCLLPHLPKWVTSNVKGRKYSETTHFGEFNIKNFIQMRTRNERFWIGLYEQRTEANWKWLDGSNYMTNFKNWKQGEPNNYGGNEDCAQVWVNGEWNDYGCSSVSYFVCEKPLPSKAAPAVNKS